MATTIRLTRMGRKKRPFYRMVVLDSRKRRDGAYLANLGYYNPFCDPAEVELHADDVINWLGKGATMSDTARSLLRGEGILYRWSLEKAGLSEEEVNAKMTEWRQASDDRRQKIQDAVVAKKEAKEAAEAKALEEKVKAEEEAKAKAEAEARAEAKAKADAEAKAAEEAAAAEAAEAAEAPEAGTEETAAEAKAEEPKKESDGEGES
ncbi:MAG: 30S ribosomal protein S16 [Gemmatimonadales bacterium]|nr:30S ribosomal protein S16 [Gemmatimonadales bacterium]